MSTEKLRYVSRRRNRNGKLRWYWRRKGFPLVRLPDDRVRRFAMAEKLNEQADRAAVIDTTEEGSVGWLIQRYQESDGFVDLAPKSKAIYQRWLREMQSMWGTMPPKVLTRRVVVTFVESVESRSSKQHAAAVLQAVLGLAQYYGLVEQNNATRLRISKPKPRKARWEWADIDAFLDACDNPAVGLAFRLMLYTAQRPIDVCKMRWSDFDGKKIRVRQQKTGALVEVPCHRDLRTALEQAKAETMSIYIVSLEDGRPIQRDWLTKQTKRISKASDLEHLQARDLRRTAIVLMGEAGATEVQIAAVSGHNIETTRQILETYLPRTAKMADAAIAKWEQS
jgi:integrase